MGETTDIVRELRRAGELSARLHVESRRVLIDAVRQAAREGLSQRDIAAAVGRSQPEVARLLRFHPTSDRGRELARHRREALEILKTAGFTAVKVFGSVARGDDHDGSDIDLMVTAAHTPSLFELARLERELSERVGSPVEITLETQIRDAIRDRALSEAVPL